MSLWTKDELIEATKGQMQGAWDANGLSIDSREIAQGDLFVALKAARDGHEFVKSALEKGAAGALVSFVPEGCEALNLLVVDDVEAALARMGQYRRAQVNAKIVAVTGSAGKTSTKEMLLTTLSHFGKTHASVKSFNNHWGVPLTLARMPRDVDFGVFEIGMNHPGEIEPLVKQVRPDVAIITNIAPVHLAGFENEAGIAREKASILRGLSKGGVGIANGDNIYGDVIADFTSEKLWFFGENAEHDLVVSQIDVSAAGTKANLQFDGEDYALNLPVSGRHHALNALAVLGTLAALDLDLRAGVDALSGWKAPSGRGEIFTILSNNGRMQLVDESYNANPLSMRAALDAFLLMDGKRHIAVLGDMAELGEDSVKFHSQLANYGGVRALDRVYLMGGEMKKAAVDFDPARTQHFEDMSALQSEIVQNLHDGDAVLIKGSNSIGLSKLVDALKEMGQSTAK